MYDNNTILNVSTVRILNDSGNRSTLVISGMDINTTKDVYFHLHNISGWNSLCIKDAAIESIRNISHSCNEQNEIYINSLPSAAPYNISYVDNVTLLIRGLYHSGIRQDCTETWSCSGWSSCGNGIQTRSCTDQNSCGTIHIRPSMQQRCSEGGSNNLETRSRGGSSIQSSARRNTSKNNTAVVIQPSARRNTSKNNTAVELQEEPAREQSNDLDSDALSVSQRDDGAEEDEASSAVMPLEKDRHLIRYFLIAIGSLIVLSLLVAVFLSRLSRKHHALASDDYLRMGLAYIEEQLKAGYSREQITLAMESVGWRKSVVDALFDRPLEKNK